MADGSDPGPRRDDVRAGASAQDDAADPVPFFDSHAHLADAAFDPDRDAAIGRAKSAGALGIVCIGESLDAATRAEAIAASHLGFVFWTAGVHPHDAAGFDPGCDIDAISAALGRGAVAIGECGLDYHYDHSPRALQRRAFAAQLAVAAQNKTPIVVHTREAEDDTTAMVREAGTAGIVGVLHCFTGSAELATVALEGGWYVSFAGITTFSKWSDDAVVRLVPPDRLLVESDSPYLAPVPNRGKRNEPAWCAYTVRRLAELRSVEPDELGAQLVANARRFFQQVA